MRQRKYYAVRFIRLVRFGVDSSFLNPIIFDALHFSTPFPLTPVSGPALPEGTGTLYFADGLAFYFRVNALDTLNFIAFLFVKFSGSE